MKALEDVLAAIKSSRLTIYDSLEDRPDLLLTAGQLESVLNRLRGLNLDYPLRTRSKVFKEAVCSTLGYPTPSGFRRTQPRFPGQNFDTYLQKADNLQIWNEEIAPGRRYAVCRVDGNNRLRNVKVITGEALERLDTTGTLTRKFQAKRISGRAGSHLASATDASALRSLLATIRADRVRERMPLSAASVPRPGEVLPVEVLYRALQSLIGKSFPNPGRDQERLRGGLLQQEVCKALHLLDWEECGQFPDILCQLLEVKLQTAATIDLGLVLPADESRLASYPDVRHCDVRYAIFYGDVDREVIRISSVVVSTGTDFFKEFVQFGGLVSNAKLQIPLPRDFFD